VVSGTPFTLKKSGSNITYAWDGSCTSPNYMIAWGNRSTLSLVSGVTQGAASSGLCALTGSSTTAAGPSISAGDCYFAVITGVSGADYGRFGNNSLGNEMNLSGAGSLCTGVTTKDTTATGCTGFADSLQSLSTVPYQMAKPKTDGIAGVTIGKKTHKGGAQYNLKKN